MTQIFLVYEPGRERPDSAREVRADDAESAARLFIAGLADASDKTRVAVIDSSGIESLFGYRQMVPRAHLDD